MCGRYTLSEDKEELEGHVDMNICEVDEVLIRF